MRLGKCFQGQKTPEEIFGEEMFKGTSVNQDSLNLKSLITKTSVKLHLECTTSVADFVTSGAVQSLDM